MPDVFASLNRLFDWRNLLDLLLVALVIFMLLRVFRGTQALQLLLSLIHI